MSLLRLGVIKQTKNQPILHRITQGQDMNQSQLANESLICIDVDLLLITHYLILHLLPKYRTCYPHTALITQILFSFPKYCACSPDTILAIQILY